MTNSTSMTNMTIATPSTSFKVLYPRQEETIDTKTANLNALTALTALDGRYAGKLAPLRAIASEYGLHRYRIIVEIEWLIQLIEQQVFANVPRLTDHQVTQLRQIGRQFSIEDAAIIKDIEQTTNHDVKACEYFLKRRLEQLGGFDDYLALIHFACTSEDINNLAYAMMLSDLIDHTIDIIAPLRTKWHAFIKSHAGTPMLARTHGQPASPTTLGKEFANWDHRLNRQVQQLQATPILAKINGAVGNFNAHTIALPHVDWPAFSNQFIQQLGLIPNPMTTQIEPHDSLCEVLHHITRINQILIDYARDIWGYIALDYFSQQRVANEVGSSTMPHKINPIDFENAEGNLGLSTALNQHLTEKLPISRWQRDLSDSTVLRNLGASFGYISLAIQALIKGTDKLVVNESILARYLDNNWAVLTEAVQTVMRAYQVPDAYEQLKAFSRGETVDANRLQTLIASLDIPDDAKARLAQLTPASYIGLAQSLALDYYESLASS